MERRPTATALLIVLVAVGCASTPIPKPTGDPGEIALDLVRGVSAEVEAREPSLLAAPATADFGIEEGVRAVRIRVIEEMDLTVRLSAAQDMTLAEPPGLCLVGPFWNPLDAGLSDRCWGDPDLTAVSGLGTELQAGEAATIEATISRGHERCDYAPGEWTLEVSLSPLVSGETFGPVRIPDVVFAVPIDESQEPLELLPLTDTRVCSYPAAVVNRQGEPEFVEP